MKFAFTITARNYLGLARALGKSLKRYNPEIRFIVFVVDIEDTSRCEVDDAYDDVISAAEVLGSREGWHQAAFKYDITEFCTSIKAQCFQYIFNEYAPDAVLYFDPDILVFSSIEPLLSDLSVRSVVVTPHITQLEVCPTGALDERSLLYSGVFNLGFIGIRNDSMGRIVVDWWERRLRNGAYQNRVESLFTDQKWIDLLPALIPNSLAVSQHWGMNVAPWNLHERVILRTAGGYRVASRLGPREERKDPLVFVHYSGFDYRRLLQGDIKQINIKHFAIPEDFVPVLEDYATAIRASGFEEYANYPYAYKVFSNGLPVAPMHRRLYRRLIEDGNGSGMEGNPFDANGGYYATLKARGLLSQSLADSEKTTLATLPGARSKTRFCNLALRLILRLFGPDRYCQLVRAMGIYSVIENHAFLVADGGRGDIRSRPTATGLRVRSFRNKEP